MAKSENIYQFARIQAVERHPDRVGACGQGLALTISSRELDDRARNALCKSFDALGYREGDCAFVQVSGLDPKELFALVEGIDPLCLVAADADAAAQYAQSVRQPFPHMQAIRIFGREARAFPLLNDQLETEADRQAVWRLLKTLPRCDA